MTTQQLWTACGLLAAVMFVANGCGESSAPPTQVAQADNHGDHDHKAGEHHAADDHDPGKKEHDHSGWWCGEHGVPEAECSMCSSKVAAALKAKGDWCNEHDRAKSQCFVCDPSLKEKFAAVYRAKEGKDPPPTEDEAGKNSKTETNKEGA